MVGYVIRRFIYMIILMVVISIVSFTIIQLPPSDYVDIRVAQLMAQGQVVAEAEIESLKRLYGLDQPPVQQYLGWVWRMLHGDLGRSFRFGQPVADLIMERLPLTPGHQPSRHRPGVRHRSPHRDLLGDAPVLHR